MADMMQGDFVHLVRVFDRHFGHLFDIRVPPALERELLSDSDKLDTHEAVHGRTPKL